MTKLIIFLSSSLGLLLAFMWLNAAYLHVNAWAPFIGAVVGGLWLASKAK